MKNDTVIIKFYLKDSSQKPYIYYLPHIQILPDTILCLQIIHNFKKINSNVPNAAKFRNFKINTHLETPANRSDLFKWLSQRVSNQFPVIQDFFNSGNKPRKEQKKKKNPFYICNCIFFTIVIQFLEKHLLYFNIFIRSLSHKFNIVSLI